jgi:hypothetical protein
MRLALVSLLLLVGSVVANEAAKPCRTYTCKPPNHAPSHAEFNQLRNATVHCLVPQIDANGDGIITEKEFDHFKKAKLGRWAIIARWSFVKHWCNCDCDPNTISWEDIQGSSENCLYSLKMVQEACTRLCPVRVCLGLDLDNELGEPDDADLNEIANEMHRRASL